MSYHRRPLRVGDRVRVESSTSPVRTVRRVSRQSAAYVSGEVRENTVLCRDCQFARNLLNRAASHAPSAEGRDLLARIRTRVVGCPDDATFSAAGPTEPISVNAFVWPE